MPAARVLDRLWAFVSSRWVTGALLASTGLAACVGLLTNPEEKSIAELAAAVGREWWFAPYAFLELHDVFHAAWFLLLLVLSALSLTALTLAKLPRARRTPGGSTPPSRFGPWLAALGAYALLAGGVVAWSSSTRGVIRAAAEREPFDSVVRHTASGLGYRDALGFSLRVDDVRVLTPPKDNEESKDFEADVAVVEGAGTKSPNDVERHTLKPGKTFRTHGVTITAEGSQTMPERDRVRLHVLDKQSGTQKDGALEKDGEIALGGVVFRAVNYTPNLAGVGSAIQIERVEGEKKTSFWVLEKYPDFDADNRGDRFGLRFGGLVPYYAVGLKVTEDPELPLLWLGGGLGLAGLALTFSGLRRKAVAST